MFAGRGSGQMVGWAGRRTVPLVFWVYGGGHLGNIDTPKYDNPYKFLGTPKMVSLILGKTHNNWRLGA